MKILGIDSSGLTASVAIVSDDILMAEYTINYKKTHSQTLLPMLDEIVKMTDLDLKDIDAIAVAAGPGSFTGLRIGSATAKGLGLALKKPIIAIPTIDALAYNLFETRGLICPIMDAKRNQVYTGIYRFEKGEFKVIKEEMAIAFDELVIMLNELKEDVIFVGDGVPVYKEQMVKIKANYFLAPAHSLRQRAGSIASLGKIYMEEGKIETAMEHKPVYLRLSQAERELAQKNKKKAMENDN